VGAGAGRVQAGDWSAVGKPVRKAEAVVDVMNVPVADAEVLFDFLGM
jgi:hypothetical protein